MKIKVIVNPNAGRRNVQKQLEKIVGRLLLSGVASDIKVTSTKGRRDATAAAAALRPGEFDLIIGCGGDGTINEILNGLMQGGSRTPLAILAAGTSNDFAFSLRLPDEADAFCAMIEAGCYRDVDIGCANGCYFINVASFGMFTEVAHNTEQMQKNALGRLAYYLQGIKDAPMELSSSMPLRIRAAEYEAEGDYHVCLVVNSMSVGSIRKLMYKADVSDGVFDVLLLKKRKRAGISLQPLEALAKLQPADLIARIKAGEVMKDPLFTYFQTAHIEFASPVGETIQTDLDGEAFGTLPLTVDVAKQAIRLLVPAESAAPRETAQ